MEIRPYRTDDLPALYDICLRTGAAGGDASATCSHPRLLGDYYAAPYAAFDPALCLILADAQGPCGYILGTTDTHGFLAWFNREWLPRIRRTYRDVSPGPGASDARLIELIQREAMAPSEAGQFPAHLHIDLLPRTQGGGWGRRMFEAWTALAAARGASGLHLGVSEANVGAQRFYERMGMRRAPEAGGCVFVMEIRRPA